MKKLTTLSLALWISLGLNFPLQAHSTIVPHAHPLSGLENNSDGTIWLVGMILFLCAMGWLGWKKRNDIPA